MPSCAANVEYRHTMRVEYVAVILRISRRLILNLECLIDRGLYERGRAKKTSVCYVDDVKQLLINCMKMKRTPFSCIRLLWKVILIMRWKKMSKEYF